MKTQNKKRLIRRIRNSFFCDICGEEKTGKKHKIYDENYNFQGCYECNDCFEKKFQKMD